MFTNAIEELLTTLEKNIRVIHADDHKLVRDAVARIIREEANHIKIVAGVASYEELFSALKTIPVDLLILDGLIIGGYPGKYLPVIREKYPNLKILLLWLDAGETSLTKWINLIDGQLNLNVNKEELILAIEKIMNGETYFTMPVFNKHKR